MSDKVLYHIGKNGAVKCPAKVKCRLGGTSGFENHFDTFEEANNVYHRQMEKKTDKGFFRRKKKLTKLDQIDWDSAPNWSETRPLVYQRVRSVYEYDPEYAQDLRAGKIDRYSRVHLDFGGYEIYANDCAEDAEEVFTRGACTLMAWELHKRTGYPIVRFDTIEYIQKFEERQANGEADEYPDMWWGGHFAVQCPDGDILDIQGKHSPENNQTLQNYPMGYHEEMSEEEFTNFIGIHEAYNNYMQDLEIKMLGRYSSELVQKHVDPDYPYVPAPELSPDDEWRRLTTQA